jgi:hypothetical protein
VFQVKTVLRALADNAASDDASGETRAAPASDDPKARAAAVVRSR